MQNHTIEDHTAARIAEGTAACTDDRTTDRTVEVAVQDPSVCARFVRNVECQMNLRTTYPTDQEHQQAI
jgi:hypothetical protein